MSRSSIHPPLERRFGTVAQVLAIARVSKTKVDNDDQDSVKVKKNAKRRDSWEKDEPSLEDQEALIRERLADDGVGPYQLKVIAGTGSGEWLDRKEVKEFQAAVASGVYDLVICEDLGRIFRRHHALAFCEACEDSNTRLVALNDNIDTAHDDWRLKAGFAALRHELYNVDTSKRIRRGLRGHFRRGGAIQFVIYGYDKPEGAKTDDQLQRVPDAKAVYEEVFRKLHGGATYAEVADWLNEENVPTGP